MFKGGMQDGYYWCSYSKDPYIKFEFSTSETISGLRTMNDKNSVDDKNAFKDFTFEVDKNGYKIVYRGQGELVCSLKEGKRGYVL